MALRFAGALCRRFHGLPVVSLCRPFSTTETSFGPKPLPPRPVISEDDITEAFLKGTGPGGQKINKTSSAVQLKHLPTGLVVKCQETRSRTQNRKIARRILAEKIEDMEKGSESRTQLKAAIKTKKKASKAKKARRKYRKLAEGKEGEEQEEEVEEDEGLDIHDTDATGVIEAPSQNAESGTLAPESTGTHPRFSGNNHG